MKLFDLGARASNFHEQLVPLDELQNFPDARAVLLEAEHDPERLKPFLAHLELVVLRFPIFRDGRPFTQARALREYLGFNGEIRAEGHILPDQAAFLKRCGVDSVVLSEGSDPALWEKQLHRFHEAYQRAVLPEAPLGVGLRVKPN